MPPGSCPPFAHPAGRRPRRHGEDDADGARLRKATRSKRPATWPRRLELAGQHNFDLLLSDLGLPDGSGHDLLCGTASARAHVSRHCAERLWQEEDIRRSYEAGFVAHLTKPASREALLEAVATAIAGKPGTPRTPELG